MQARRTCQPRRAAATSRESATAGSGSVTDSLDLLDSLLGSREKGKWWCWPDASTLLLLRYLRLTPGCTYCRGAKGWQRGRSGSSERAAGAACCPAGRGCSVRPFC